MTDQVTGAGSTPPAPRILKDIWAGARSAGSPRVIALGVAHRGQEVLLESFQVGAARQTLYRPPGGGVRFGERTADALRREMREELGEEVRPGPLLTVVEDIFDHEGHAGHEIVFVYEMEFVDPTVYHRDALESRDHQDIPVPLRWFPIGDLGDLGDQLPGPPPHRRRHGPLPLCPPGLAEVLMGAGAGW